MIYIPPVSLETIFLLTFQASLDESFFTGPLESGKTIKYKLINKTLFIESTNIDREIKMEILSLYRAASKRPLVNVFTVYHSYPNFLSGGAVTVMYNRARKTLFLKGEWHQEGGGDFTSLRSFTNVSLDSLKQLASFEIFQNYANNFDNFDEITKFGGTLVWQRDLQTD